MNASISRPRGSVNCQNTFVLVVSIDARRWGTMSVEVPRRCHRRSRPQEHLQCNDVLRPRPDSADQRSLAALGTTPGSGDAACRLFQRISKPGHQVVVQRTFRMTWINGAGKIHVLENAGSCVTLASNKPEVCHEPARGRREKRQDGHEDGFVGRCADASAHGRQPPPVAANGGRSYTSFDRDGDAGTAKAPEDALAKIAAGEASGPST